MPRFMHATRDTVSAMPRAEVPADSRATSPDVFLARRAAKGDAAAWDTLVERFGEPIYNLAYRFAGQPEEAEDLTQEIFLRLYNQLHRYRGDVPLLAWTLRLSRNLCIDHYRYQKARRQDQKVGTEVLERLPADDRAEQRHERREQRRLVLEALDELSELSASALMMRDFQGLSYEEIASFFEVPVGTIKSRLNRARRDLVAVLARRLDLGEGEGARADRSEARRQGGTSC